MALARVAARLGGVYSSHVRDEANRVFEAVAEAAEVGRQAQLPVQVSHLKVASKRLHREGVDVVADQYPCTTGRARNWKPRAVLGARSRNVTMLETAPGH